MENGVQALKLGASMLIFVIAITITISVFTMAAQALNRIFIAEEDQEYVKDSAGQYINFVNFDGGTREVGIETIVPAIYRAYSENYCMYFYEYAEDGKTLKPYGLYNEGSKEVNWIGQVNDMIPDKDERESKVTAEELFNEKDIYNTLKGKTFTEMLGEYIIGEEAKEEDAEENPEEEEQNNSESGPNKIKKRIMVYILKN